MSSGGARSVIFQPAFFSSSSAAAAAIFVLMAPFNLPAAEAKKSSAATRVALVFYGFLFFSQPLCDDDPRRVGTRYVTIRVSG